MAARSRGAEVRHELAAFGPQEQAVGGADPDVSRRVLAIALILPVSRERLNCATPFMQALHTLCCTGDPQNSLQLGSMTTNFAGKSWVVPRARRLSRQQCRVGPVCHPNRPLRSAATQLTFPGHCKRHVHFSYCRRDQQSILRHATGRRWRLRDGLYADRDAPCPGPHFHSARTDSIPIRRRRSPTQIILRSSSGLKSWDRGSIFSKPDRMANNPLPPCRSNRAGMVLQQSSSTSVEDCAA